MNTNTWKWIFGIFLGLLVVVNLVTAGYLYYQKSLLNSEQARLSNETEAIINDLTNLNASNMVVETTVINFDELLPVEDTTTGIATVNWLESPSEVAIKDFLPETAYARYLKTRDSYGAEMTAYVDSSTRAYKIGEVASGPYAGSSLYFFEQYMDGPVTYPRGYHLIVQGERFIVLGKYSEEPFDFIKLFELNNNLTIANLDTPSIINIPGSKIVLQDYTDDKLFFWETYKRVRGEELRLEEIFKYDGKNYIYRLNNGCYLAIAPDQTMRIYRLTSAFLSAEANRSMFTATKLGITWLDGKVNQTEYFLSSQSACGNSLGCYVSPAYVTADILKKTGKSIDGADIYELRDPAFQSGDSIIMKDFYDMIYPGYDEATGKMADKISYEKFLADHPIIFWKDPFGNYVQFTSAKYVPAVECGKPVIYLYPEEETNVSVKVAPEGGFMKTEPAYNGEWRVLARPNGELINLTDRKIYPYLFWEGYALGYTRPKEGFVVARAEVKEFFDSTLKKQGLNEVEIADFEEFWLPKFTTAPYYFITFVPQMEFDRLAPLQVSPAPDTVIRVFMDYEPLETRIAVRAPELLTPVRRGFTVVEWGGALHK